MYTRFYYLLQDRSVNMINKQKVQQRYFITEDGIKIPLTKNWKQLDEFSLKNMDDGSVFIFCRLKTHTKLKSNNRKVQELFQSITKYGGFFISQEHAAIEEGKVVFRKSNNIISLDKDIIRRLMKYKQNDEKNAETLVAYNTGSKRISVMTPLKLLYSYILYNKKILNKLKNPMVEISYECEPVKLNENETVNTGIRGVLVIR